MQTCCLYLCLGLLSSLILLTSFVLHWILASIQFSVDGVSDPACVQCWEWDVVQVGVASLVQGGIKISGQTFLMDSAFAARLVG